MWPVMNRWGLEADPFSELRQLHRQVSRLFDGGGGASPEFPALNLWGNADEVRVAVEAPGLDPEKIELTVNGNVLSIEGERPADEVGENDVVYRRERLAGHFHRTVRLPYEVDNDRISARYVNGVLHISLPRSEATKPRKIQIEA